MANKTIPQLQLRDNVSDDLNFPSDDSVQSYRVTAAQLLAYILAAGNVEAAALATDSVETLKIKDANVTLAKLAATVQASLNPVGSLMPFAGTSAPTGYLFCYGQAISRSTYADLFSALSTTYGSGDGSTTFNLPDLRGRVIAGKDDMGGSSANRLTSPLNGDTLGAAGGGETHAHDESFSIGGSGRMNMHDALAGAGSNTVNGTWNWARTSSSPEGTTASRTFQDTSLQPTFILNYIIKT